MLGTISGAQFDIDNAIVELARSGADSAALANQGQALQQLQRTVGSANLGSLLALRSEVATVATSATALANQVTSTAANSAANANMSSAQRARANIEAVGRDLFEKRVLDPYLQFASAEDEEAYRKRERERKEAYDAALAQNTPEGTHLATRIADAQLRDAGAHGADKSPAFNSLLDRTSAARSAIEQPAQPDLPHDRAPPVASNDVASIAATLRAAGLTAQPTSPPSDGHGLNPDMVVAVGRNNEGRG